MPVESIGTLGIPSITGRPTGWTAIETGCAVLVLGCGISMYLATKILRRDLRSVLSAQIFHGTLFWNVSRPKREGLVDPQFKLLSVGSIG
jgi:hypothetical protein